MNDKDLTYKDIFQGAFINIASLDIITTWVRQGKDCDAQFKDEIAGVQRGQINLPEYTSSKGRAWDRVPNLLSLSFECLRTIALFPQHVNNSEKRSQPPKHRRHRILPVMQV